MTKKSGKAEVSFETHIVPYAGGACDSVPVAEETVEAALSGFNFTRAYTGFQFAKVAKARVNLEGEELSFVKKEIQPTFYEFAEKLISDEEFRTHPKYRQDFKNACARYPDRLNSGNAFHYETNDGYVGVRDRREMDNLVMITHQGRQLWPRPKS